MGCRELSRDNVTPIRLGFGAGDILSDLRIFDLGGMEP